MKKPSAAVVKRMCTDMLVYLLSGCIFAVGIKVFTAPNRIAPGGVTGLSTVVNFVTGFPIGMLALLLNLPIFIWAIFEIGYKLVGKTIVAAIITSVAIDLLGLVLKPYQGDPMLAAVFGGLLEGISLSLVFKRGATTGGTDMIARLLKRHFPHLSTGRLMMCVDMVIVLLSAVVYRRIESVLYAVIYLFISTNVIDAILYGTDIGTGKVLWIVSSKPEEIAEAIQGSVDRGVTAMHARGMYSGREGEVLMVAVGRSEAYRAMDAVRAVDRDAFMIMGDAAQISGEGFKLNLHEDSADKTLPQLMSQRKKRKKGRTP